MSRSEDETLRRFFAVDGRLLDLPPASHPARNLVLGSVAQLLGPGRDLDWREVDAVLRTTFRDHAALRRALVDDGFLTRADGVYRRTTPRPGA